MAMQELIIESRIKLSFYSKRIERGNFGDLLSKYMIEKLTGAIVEKYDRNKRTTAHLTAIGSILNEKEICQPAVIWGSGFTCPEPLWKIKLTKIQQFLRGKYGHPTVCAVRGKLTRDLLVKAGIDCPETYGDPALLMPMIYPVIKQKKYRLGVVLHLAHQGFKDAFVHRDVKWIDVSRSYDDIESFIDELLECDTVLSSSLHGLIIANAYKVPCVRLKIKDHSILQKSEWEDFKFADYLSGLNSYCKNSNPYDFSVFVFNENDVFDVGSIDKINNMANVPSFDIDYSTLLSAFPCRLLHEYDIRLKGNRGNL